MTPAFAQAAAPYTGPKASDVYNPASPLMQDAENPMGFPTPSPTPKPRSGLDWLKSLFSWA